MDKDEAIKLALQLYQECGFEVKRYEAPETCLLTEFGINKEGYGLYCEGYHNFKSVVQNCIITFLKKRRLQKKEIGADALLFE